MAKQYALDAVEIRPLAIGFGSCFASDRIAVDCRTVGYMYREKSDGDPDSVWHFFAGDESDVYTANAENFGIFDVNTIANYDPAIVPLLSAPIGSAYMRSGDGKLVAVNH
jgi:hypothetical protein